MCFRSGSLSSFRGSPQKNWFGPKKMLGGGGKAEEEGRGKHRGD